MHINLILSELKLLIYIIFLAALFSWIAPRSTKNRRTEFHSNMQFLPKCHLEHLTTAIETDEPEEYNTSLKKILFYTGFFKRADFYFGFGHTPFVESGCPVSNCFVTSNRSMLNSIGEFDAVVFHLLDLLNRTNGWLHDVSIPCRSQHQRYVMTVLEAPLAPKSYLYSRQWKRNDFPYQELNGFFNWTMTYRLDSDIPFPHGWVERKGERRSIPQRDEDNVEWMPYNETDFLRTLHLRNESFFEPAKRPKLAIWVVSHCWTRSRREDYVRELNKYIDVDVMGKCGETCGRLESGGLLDKTTDNCSVVFEGDYKFYLSFENTLCHGYLTEKLWARLQFPIVPVVLGRHNFSQVMPPHSFINAEDFGSIRALAQYLLYLDSHDEQYLSYFWWKDHYRSIIRGRSIKVAMCELCRMLNNPNLPEKSLSDVKKWWWDGGKCTDFPNWAERS